MEKRLYAVNRPDAFGVAADWEIPGNRSQCESSFCFTSVYVSVSGLHYPGDHCTVEESQKRPTGIVEECYRNQGYRYKIGFDIRIHRQQDSESKKKLTRNKCVAGMPWDHYYRYRSDCLLAA